MQTKMIIGCKYTKKHIKYITYTVVLRVRRDLEVMDFIFEKAQKKIHVIKKTQVVKGKDLDRIKRYLKQF